MIDFLSFAAAMLKALAAPMVLDEKKSVDWRCGGDEKLGGALFDGNKLDTTRSSLLAGERGADSDLLTSLHPRRWLRHLLA